MSDGVKISGAGDGGVCRGRDGRRPPAQVPDKTNKTKQTNKQTNKQNKPAQVPAGGPVHRDRRRRVRPHSVAQQCHGEELNAGWEVSAERRNKREGTKKRVKMTLRGFKLDTCERRHALGTRRLRVAPAFARSSQSLQVAVRKKLDLYLFWDFKIWIQIVTHLKVYNRLREQNLDF